MSDYFNTPDELVLGRKANQRVPMSEQHRQRGEAEEVLSRLGQQPGVILADEVGMGKTFVALAAIYAVGIQSPKGPVVVMVPPNLVDKWEQDLDAFCTLYLNQVVPRDRNGLDAAGNRLDLKELRRPGVLRYGVARHSIEFLKLLDDRPRDRCHIVFLAQGAMSRAQTDIWVRLALIRETLRRHGRRTRLNKIKRRIHRYLAELLYAKGQQRASDAGDEIWSQLLKTDPKYWKDMFNESLKSDRHWLYDDPVPRSVSKALSRSELDLNDFAEALADMPLRTSAHTSSKIAYAREQLKYAERGLWKQIIAIARWRSPLLVLDEAHHLKNPKTALARQLQHQDSESDLKLGDGAMAGSFDRMLFLTATPFQLGHHELVRVLQRFGDVRWDEDALGDKEQFETRLTQLNECLTSSQRASIRLQKAWSRLREDDFNGAAEIDKWWEEIRKTPLDSLTHRQRTLVEAYQQARLRKDESERQLRPWIIRHNKGEFWERNATIRRRQRFDGAAISGKSTDSGIDIPGDQLLPFFLAARSATHPGKDLLGEALCSSYEAFRQTRRDNASAKDDFAEDEEPADLTHSAWFLSQFDEVIAGCSATVHPKIHATVQKAADLWESGEKVLVFAFYRHTCRALRIHISNELEKRLLTHARRRLAGAGRATDEEGVAKIIQAVQDNFFDRPESPGRRALDTELKGICEEVSDRLPRDAKAKLRSLRERIVKLMRSFLRVETTLIRAFPLHRHDVDEKEQAVAELLNWRDESGLTWRDKFSALLYFLILHCSDNERENYLAAAETTETGRISVRADDPDYLESEDRQEEKVGTLANVRVATGETPRSTRSNLMRSFNTPFFPDILVCSQVMGEGVDLHRYCRHVIHHDLDWNPSSIEQRTGRVDRLGCKAESRHPIPVYVPYLAGTADERQYRVMTDRESWFRIVMGQEEVARLISESDGERDKKPPASFQDELIFQLDLQERSGG